MSAQAQPKQSFAAFRYPGYRIQFASYVLAMMADNIEHVISYWMVFQKFHSPSLGGFAVLSHWLPFLVFSVAVGALCDRFDPRRIIQCGMGLFILASIGWGYFFITDTLSVWGAMVLLVIHGCAGVLWQTPNQLLLYDIVGPTDLPSAVRLNATARYLGVLVGPAVGGVILLALGRLTASSSTRYFIFRCCCGSSRHPMVRAFARPGRRRCSARFVASRISSTRSATSPGIGF
jgi:MFS family permease